MTPQNRSAYAVLVPSAHSTAAIGVIRSLGKAGYRVHAAAAEPVALGLRSRYAAQRVVHPPTGSPAFASWFADYVQRHQIAMIIPGGGFHPSHPVLRDYARLFPIGSDPAALEATLSKAELFARLAKGGEARRANLPPLLLVDFDRDLPAEVELAELPAPLFIKLDAALARDGAGDLVLRVDNAAEARRRLEPLAARYRKAMVQGYVPGRGAGAFLLRWNRQTRARMMHLRLHEMPHTGGASSLRRTWWHQAMMRDAELKLTHLDWQGVAMVEYRWDAATDRFYLMEINLRFWGSLHLALFAGVDFPRLLADAFFFDEIPENVVENTKQVICRNTLPFELGYLVSLWRDRDVPLVRKLYAGLEAVTLSLNPRVRNDLLFPGDRKLFFARLKDLAIGTYHI